MHVRHIAVLAVPLLLLTACAGGPEEPSIHVSEELHADEPGEPGRRASPTADASPFYPTTPVVRTFAYSRMAPDGSKVVGELSLAVLRVSHSEETEPRLRMAAIVRFRANAVIFSPGQARAFNPEHDWPDDLNEYPMGVKDIVEDYGFVSALPQRIQADPEALVLFWTRGVLSYMGFSKPPGRFMTTGVDLPKDDLTPFCVRGVFTSNSQPAGAFLLTFRKDSGLTGITGVLPDGTIIALVERMRFEQDGDEPEEVDEEPEWDGLLTRAQRQAAHGHPGRL